jgi:hypothetical protein
MRTSGSASLLVKGTCGLRQVRARPQRTKVDWALEMKELLTTRFAEAEKVLLVCDNLNTHTKGAFYKAFPSEQARALVQRLEFHDTPKHGSWLNIAENELSCRTRQCLKGRRTEDIEKIDFVFTHKREIPKYSRLADKSEIANEHDYNLNIRRYVDNTPDPEPEDVQAHLIGGIPEEEVFALQNDFARFGVQRDLLFHPERPGYLAFRECIDGVLQFQHCPRNQLRGPQPAVVFLQLAAKREQFLKNCNSLCVPSHAHRQNLQAKLQSFAGEPAQKLTL